MFQYSKYLHWLAAVIHHTMILAKPVELIGTLANTAKK